MTEVLKFIDVKKTFSRKKDGNEKTLDLLKNSDVSK